MDRQRECDQTCTAHSTVDPFCKLLQILNLAGMRLEDEVHPYSITTFPESAPPPEVK